MKLDFGDSAYFGLARTAEGLGLRSVIDITNYGD
jgi:hypothetical protein